MELVVRTVCRALDVHPSDSIIYFPKSDHVSVSN